jgi:pyocin large subunit-like protein
MLRRLLALGITAFSFVAACGRGDGGVVQQQARSAAVAPVAPAGQPIARSQRPAATQSTDGARRSNVGFRSRAQFDEHFQKHGAEFGHVTQQEYLREAQALRDAPVDGNIEEIRRDDGTSSRFDRSSGAFLAFNRDGTIRTFFKPNDGEAYFRRQASRVH